MIFINQLREKIGVFFGSPETTSGGKALKFYASVRLDIRRIETLKDGTDAVGNRTRVKVVKNKMAPPFKQAEFDILYGVGISREGSLIDYGVEHEIVRKSGAWYTYDGDQLGQGKENARSFLLENPEIADEIEKKILTKLGVGAGKPTAVPPLVEAPTVAAKAPPRSRRVRCRIGRTSVGRRRRRVPDAQGIRCRFADAEGVGRVDPWTETDGRLAPVIYLPGVVPPIAPASARRRRSRPLLRSLKRGWNNTWSVPRRI